MPQSFLASAGTVGIILLVEDYDALGAAFGSALRRLAPNHETRVVRSLVEAEQVSADYRPDLLVIDFDPPPRETIAFFGRMKATNPHARALVIAPNIWPDLPLLRIRPGALHFIEKPFELPGLSAALQILLQPRDLQNPGTFADLDLTDLIALASAGGLTNMIAVTSPGGQTGFIYFSAGQMVHAAAAEKMGSPALEEMLRWKAPRLSERSWPNEPPLTIRDRTSAALADALRAVRAIEPAVEIPPARAIAPTAVGKTIVVIDDTEMLLIFVEEVLRTADETLRTVGAPNGLDGLKRIHEAKPDLVLLDFDLPDIAGDEVCRRLLADDRTAKIPVIIMSGHVTEMTATAKSFRNVIATIAKPFRSAALISLVEKSFAKLDSPAQSPPAPPSQKVGTENHQKAPPAKSPERVDESQKQPAPAAKLLLLESSTETETSEVRLPQNAARVPGAKASSVILALPLEVAAIRFSSSMKIAAISAKPYSSLVTLRAFPLAAAKMAPRNFRIEQCLLDAHGGIETLRLAPARAPVGNSEVVRSMGVENVVVSAGDGGEALEMINTTTPMRIQLLTLLELVAVELVTDFRVACLVVKTRGAKVRVNFPGTGTENGMTFRAAHLRLDRPDRIAEISLHTTD